MCHTFVSKHTIRAVRLALMSLGMTFSFTPEVQITKSYCKNTMKIHWGYIGKYIVLTKGHIRIFEKKNEPERTEKDWIINHASVVSSNLNWPFSLRITAWTSIHSNYDTAPTQGWWNIFSRLDRLYIYIYFFIRKKWLKAYCKQNLRWKLCVDEVGRE